MKIPKKFKTLKVSWDPEPEMEVVKKAYPETQWKQQAKAIAYNNTWIVVYHNAHINGWKELFGPKKSRHTIMDQWPNWELKTELESTLEKIYLEYLNKS